MEPPEKFSVNARDAGAIEWQVHPLALLRLAVVADVHWVKVGFVIDGTAELKPGPLSRRTASRAAVLSRTFKLSDSPPDGRVPPI